MPSVEKALFIGGRAINQATLTSTGEVDTLPVTNLQEYMPEKKYRALSNITTIYVNFPTPLACNTAAIIGHNCTNTAYCRIKGGADLASVSTGTPAVDSGNINMWPTTGKPTDEEWPQWSSLIRFSNATPYAWYSIYINDNLNTDVLQIGRLMLDWAFRPIFNIGHNYGISLTLADVQTRTAFNRLYTERRGPPARSFALPLSYISLRDLWDNIFTMSRLYGIYDDFFMCIDPGATTDLHRTMMQCMFTDTLTLESQPVFDSYGNVWKTTMTLLELV